MREILRETQAINKFLAKATEWKTQPELREDRLKVDLAKDFRPMALPDYIRSQDFLQQDFLTDEGREKIRRLVNTVGNALGPLRKPLFMKNLYEQVYDAKHSYEGNHRVLNSEVRKKGEDAQTHFTSLSEDVIGQYRDTFKQVIDTLNMEDIEGNIKIDPEHMETISTELLSSYQKVNEIHAILESFALNDAGKLNAYEREFFDVLSLQVRQELKKIEDIKKKVDLATDSSRAFEKTSFDYAQDTVSKYREIEFISKSLVTNLRKGDFLGVVRSAVRAKTSLKREPKAGDLNKGQKQVENALRKAGLGKALMAMAGIEIAIKAVKQLVMAVFGVNDYANEFNKELMRGRGLISIGIPLEITADVSTEMVDHFAEIQRRYTEFGANSKTYLTPESLSAASRAFENEGMKFYEMFQDQTTFEKSMETILKAQYGLGISYEEASNHVAELNYRNGLSLEEINFLTSRMSLASDTTGFRLQHFYEVSKTLNDRYGVSVDRYATVVELQKQALEEGRIGGKAQTDAMNTFFKKLVSMPEESWATILQPVIQSGALPELISAEIERYATIEEAAKSDRIKQQAAYRRAVLLNALKDDEFYQIRAIVQHGSEDLKSRLFLMGMEMRGQERWTEGIEDGFLKHQEQTLMAQLMGYQKGSKEEAQIIESVFALTRKNSVLTKEEMYKSVYNELERNAEKYEGMGETTMAVIQHTTKFKDMWAAMVTKYTFPIMNWFHKVFTRMRDGWLGKLLFGQAKDPAKALAISSNIRQLISLAQENPADASRYASDIESNIELLRKEGVNVGNILSDIASSRSLPPEVEKVFNRHGGRSLGFRDIEKEGDLTLGEENFSPRGLSPEFEGYDASLGARLADVAPGMAVKYNRYHSLINASGRCLSGVHWSIDAIGLGKGLYGMGPDQYQHYLAQSQNFKEVAIGDYTNFEKNAPLGTVVLIPAVAGTGKKHGHIFIFGKDGYAYSDFREPRIGSIMRAKNRYPKSVPRAFIPVSTRSLAAANDPPKAPDPYNIGNTKTKNTTVSYSGPTPGYFLTS